MPRLPSLALADAVDLDKNGKGMTNGPEKVNGNALINEDGMVAALKDGKTITYGSDKGWGVGVREAPCTSHLSEFIKPRKRRLRDIIFGRP